MKNKEEVYEFLQILSKAPDTQIDKRVTDRLRNLIGKDQETIKTEVMHCIDDCVYGGLSSGFALKSLMLFHEVYLDGKDSDFNDENCPWRK